MNLCSITDQAKAMVTQQLKPGDRAIDATSGNGWDTVALAEAVGSEGKVIALDVQADAVAATRGLLGARGLDVQVEVIQACHSTLAEIVTEPVQAVMFNLGYLPHGDKALTTTWETTLCALDQARGLLTPGGVLSVVTYPGHEAGAREHVEIVSWLERQERARVAHVEVLFLQREAPQLFLLTI